MAQGLRGNKERRLSCGMRNFSPVGESVRLYRRLPMLRGWSHGKANRYPVEVRAGGRLVRTTGWARHAVVGDHVGSRQTGARRRRSAGCGAGGCGRPPGATQAGARMGAQASERDSTQGVGVFRSGGARPPTQVMVDFIDEHRSEYGVEPICAVLPIAPSTYYAHRACRLDPERRCARAKRDEALARGSARAPGEPRRRLRRQEVWRQLLREGIRSRDAPSGD